MRPVMKKSARALPFIDIAKRNNLWYTQGMRYERIALPMKRWIAALLCVLLMWSPAALAGSYTAKDGGALFTLRYDDKRYALDQYSYLNSSTSGNWFFILYDAQHSIDCGLEYTDRGMGASIRGAASLDLYQQAVCDATGGRAVEVYYAGTQPFVIVSARHPGVGQVYYAETILGGNAIYFEMYNLSTGVADESCLQELKAVLDGFMPLQ